MLDVGNMRERYRCLLAGLLLLVTASAWAGEIKPFDPVVFNTLQAAGKLILIDVYADWCPTCKQQIPIISRLMTRHEFRNYTVLMVNFDSRKDLLRKFRVAEQSTFIVYRGKREVTRSTGDTREDSIAASLREALS